MAGVGAGTGAMNSLLGKLAALLGDQYRLLRRIRKEVEFLQREIRRMQALLKTLSDMHKLEELEKDWKCNVRELTYDIEDCIDRFMDRLGKGDARPGFVRKTVRRLKNLWERHGIATKIKDLKARVIEESQRRDRSLRSFDF
jgi:disease resistance protein RPM1